MFTSALHCHYCQILQVDVDFHCTHILLRLLRMLGIPLRNSIPCNILLQYAVMPHYNCNITI